MLEPYIYKAVFKVLDDLAAGMTETKACDKQGITAKQFRDARKRDPEIETAYEEAMRRGTDALVDLLTDIDALLMASRGDVRAAKVLSENVRWVAERRNRKAYGSKVEVDQKVTVAMDKVIVDAIDAGRRRALGDIEEAEVVTPPALPVPDDLADLM